MSAASEAAAIRRLVIAQIVILALLAVFATGAAVLIVLRYDRPQSSAKTTSVKFSERFDPNVALPIPADRKSIVIVPREGETGPLHLPSGTSMGGGSAVL